MALMAALLSSLPLYHVLSRDRSKRPRIILTQFICSYGPDDKGCRSVCETILIYDFEKAEHIITYLMFLSF